jgi:hypothetical protein
MVNSHPPFIILSTHSLTNLPRLPRPDVEKAVTIHRQPPQNISSFSDTDNTCHLCSSTWFLETESACLLACKKHWLCLDCVYELTDEAGKGKLQPGETDPGNKKFWRCTMCRHIHPVLADRATIIADDEFAYWKYKIAKYRLNEVNANWPTLLFNAEVDGWCAPLPQHLDHDRADVAEIVKARVVTVRVNDAIAFVDAVPIFIAKLLHWGYSLDSPVSTAEGEALRACLVKELQRLAKKKRKVHTDELKKHLLEVGKKAVNPVVVADKGERLGNPIYPPGYEAYRDFLCEWTAKGCFLSASGRRDVVQFMERMKKEKTKGWWKDVREVWFNR